MAKLPPKYALPLSELHPDFCPFSGHPADIEITVLEANVRCRALTTCGARIKLQRMHNESDLALKNRAGAAWQRRAT